MPFPWVHWSSGGGTARLSGLEAGITRSVGDEAAATGGEASAEVAGGGEVREHDPGIEVWEAVASEDWRLM